MGRRRKGLPDVLDGRSLVAMPKMPPMTSGEKKAVVRVVDAYFERLEGQRPSLQGRDVKDKQPPPPHGGRPGTYPGTRTPSGSDDAGSRLHLRWALLFMSSLHQMRVPYTDIATRAAMGNETLRDLLRGVRSGLTETRRRAAWALFRHMLETGSFPPEVFCRWVDSDGQWDPYWPAVSNWTFGVDGYVTAWPVRTGQGGVGESA